MKQRNEAGGDIVYGWLVREHPSVNARLWRAMFDEFSRNGRRMLTAGKVRYLRRRLRRGGLRGAPVTAAEAAAAARWNRPSIPHETVDLDPLP